MTSLVRRSDSGHLEHLMATVSTYVAHENKGGTCIECFEFEVVKVVPFANPADQTAGNAFGIDIRVQTLDNIARGVANLPYKLRNETFCPAHTLKGKFAPYFISHPLCQCDMSLGPDTVFTMAITHLSLPFHLPVQYHTMSLRNQDAPCRPDYAFYS
jgi:hypothetical protein